MSACVFSERFNTIPSTAIASLSHEYATTNGRTPSRHRLRELSHQLAVSQARIKKWFQERADGEERERRRERQAWVEESRRERMWRELGECLHGIDEALDKFEAANRR